MTRSSPVLTPQPRLLPLPFMLPTPLFPRLPSLSVGLLLATSLLWTAPSLLGQAACADARPPSAAPEEVVALSPFIVTSDKDTGYAATNTLAGTRLNTPVKDLGASISIYTKDFLDDIGATNEIGRAHV